MTTESNARRSQFWIVTIALVGAILLSLIGIAFAALTLLFSDDPRVPFVGYLAISAGILCACLAVAWLPVAIAWGLSAKGKTRWAYLVACIPLTLAAYPLTRLWPHTLKPTPSSEVRVAESAYPEPNPHPVWMLHIGGELPASIPFEYFEAQYETDANNDPACIRAVSGVQGGGFRLKHTELIEPVREGQRYSASVGVDKFKPGQCRWRLWRVTFRYKGDGDALQPGDIEPADTTFGAALHTGPSHRIDIWCKKAPPDLHIAEICGDPTGLDHGPYGSLYLTVYPDGIPLEVNFHDLYAGYRPLSIVCPGMQPLACLQHLKHP